MCRDGRIIRVMIKLLANTVLEQPLRDDKTSNKFQVTASNLSNSYIATPYYRIAKGRNLSIEIYLYFLISGAIL